MHHVRYLSEEEDHIVRHFVIKGQRSVGVREVAPVGEAGSALFVVAHPVFVRDFRRHSGKVLF